ncbi:MAG: hypothetical protein ACRD00_04835, partial [Thermoanaerobaculia bacterium]
ELVKQNSLRRAAVDLAFQQDEKLEKIATTTRNITAALDLAGIAAAALAGTDFGDFIGGLVGIANAAEQARESGIAAKDAFETGGTAGKLQAVGAGAQTALSIFEQNRQQRSGAQGALSGAAQGAAFGAAFGPYGVVIGAVVGGLIGFFSGSRYRRIARDAGRVLGEGLSDETISAIQEDVEKLGIKATEASLLHITDAIKDTGKAASEFGSQIGDLLAGIASGEVPAVEGIEELGKAFNLVAEEALAAGRVGDRVLTDLIKKSRELGIESPEIKAFVAAQLGAATAGVEKFIESLKVLSGPAIEKIGADAGIIFGAAFSANVSEIGIVAAVDAMQESFESLRDTLSQTLDEATVAAILGPFAAAFDTIGNENLRPIFEGIDGLSQAMQGLANSAFLTVDQFNAIGRATGVLFDEAIAGGADMRTALLAVSPAIQAAITAAEQFGIPLDADTQRLKDLAEQNGIAFKTDPMDRAADAIETLAIALDKAFNLGLNLEDQFNRVADAAEGAGDAVTGPG